MGDDRTAFPRRRFADRGPREVAAGALSAAEPIVADLAVAFVIPTHFSVRLRGIQHVLRIV